MGSIYIEGYPGTLQPPRTAFEHAGAALDDAVCIYMTNRYSGRWSLLLPAGFEARDDPQNHISMGYTQLWILQPLWVVLARATAGTEPVPTDALEPFEKGTTRDDYPALLHVFREPVGDMRDHNDHLGGRRDLADAIDFAQAYARRWRRTSMVAKMLQDWSWH